MDLEINRANQENNPRQSKIKWGGILAWVGLLVILAIIFFGLYNSQKGQFKIGEKAPEFTLTTFEGEEYRSSEFTGKVILLNIWASWCKPCEQEASDLEAAWRFYQPRGDVVFLGVAWTDTDKKSNDYLDRFEITYPNGPDLGTRIFQAFRATGVPETYIIDRQGVVAFTKFSPFTSLDEVKQAIDLVLGE